MWEMLRKGMRKTRCKYCVPILEIVRKVKENNKNEDNDIRAVFHDLADK